ncbi:MAG: sialate O-acetylesterase [Lachnospiraceae bacterium]|nr:sialate O-acetylesterase [Lachnospiraceae bacterium]
MAKFKVAAVFSDHCVLQQGKPCKIFGWGEEGRVITVEVESAEGKQQKVAEVKDERWVVSLNPMKAQIGVRMTVFDGDRENRTYTDIAVGEVWLCGGQSNMEFELQNMTGGKEHLEKDHPNVRFYYTQKNGYMDDKFFQDEGNTSWSLFGPEDAKAWSAAGYLFGKKLSEALGVTVGLIGCNWGGTSASVWMRKEALLEDKETAIYWNEYVEKNKDKSEEEQIKEYLEYEAYDKAWFEKSQEVYKQQPNISWDALQEKIGKNLWPGPINCRNPYRPGGLYECMLQRVAPYTLKGWLFYQGESDDHRPVMYKKLFSRMIQDWRELWGEELPMIFCQLPGNRYQNDPDYKHWCLIREAQEEVSKMVKDAYMSVLIDAGEFNDIHPKDKEPVGERMYRTAMTEVYHMMKSVEGRTPAIEAVKFDGRNAVVSFRDLGDGLEVRNVIGRDKPISGFELAGEDKVFYPAVGRLSGTGVVVSSDAVPLAKYLRYLWTNYPVQVDLYGVNGLPVPPYRSSKTDSFEAGTHATEIQQIMTV